MVSLGGFSDIMAYIATTERNVMIIKTRTYTL
jgi:hypothetical protein